MTACTFRYHTEHGEPRTCRRAMKDHYDGMDEPHVFKGERMNWNPTISDRTFRNVTRLAIFLATLIATVYGVQRAYGHASFTDASAVTREVPIK